MVEIKQQLNKFENMSDQERLDLKEIISKRTDLDEILDYILDEYYEYYDNPDDELSHNILYKDLIQFILNKIKKNICGDIENTDIEKLSKECQIKVIDNMLPDTDDLKDLKQDFVDNINNDKPPFHIQPDETNTWSLDKNRNLKKL